MKSYKVEAKGSLWEVSIERGEYSDWDIDYFVFSANTQEECQQFVKKWFLEGGLEKYYIYGLVFDDGEKVAKENLPEYMSKRGMDWETSYGDAAKVNINRLHVIYVQP